MDLALLDKFDQVRDIFETTATFDNTQFRAVANTSQTKSFSFAMDITYSGGAITDVSIGGDNTLFNINGTLLQGKAGTAYEGLSLLMSGHPTQRSILISVKVLPI